MKSIRVKRMCSPFTKEIYDLNKIKDWTDIEYIIITELMSYSEFLKYMEKFK